MFVDRAAVSGVVPPVLFWVQIADYGISPPWIIASWLQWLFTMGLVASSILDVVVTASLLWYLDHARTGFAG